MPNNMWVIEDWSTRSPNTVYDPPEVWVVVIQGRCPNRPGFETGIQTSPIVRVKGRRIWTRSGSTYVLGKPNPDFVEYCKRTKCHVPTLKHPLKIRSLDSKESK